MKKEDYVFLIFIPLVIGFFTGFINGRIIAKRYEKSAVKAGVEERIVDEDDNGKH